MKGTPRRARIAAGVCIACALAGCGDGATDGPDGELAGGVTDSAADVGAASTTDSSVDSSADATGSLDLALLLPLPEFVEPSDAAAPADGHVAAHGDLVEPDVAAARALDAVPLTWSDLSAPAYVAPALMANATRPPLSDVLAEAVLGASGTRVVLDGFGTVERRAGDAVVELMLTRLPLACCLGGFPGASERVHARVDPALALEVDPWTPLRLVGRFAVDERRDELGLFEGLYFLEVTQAPVGASGAR